VAPPSNTSLKQGMRFVEPDRFQVKLSIYMWTYNAHRVIEAESFADAAERRLYRLSFAYDLYWNAFTAFAVEFAAKDLLPRAEIEFETPGEHSLRYRDWRLAVAVLVLFLGNSAVEQMHGALSVTGKTIIVRHHANRRSLSMQLTE
jgi:hypothetical protein